MAASLAFLLAACQSIPDTDESALAARPLRQCGGPLALAGRVSVNYTRDREEQMESLHGKFT
ncbi:MAG: hypothetical protein LBM56_04060, partial [Burkholderiaceae bacterium]|nr:hypothetical protein [Burkholderiaceae bacterium]